MMPSSLQCRFFVVLLVACLVGGSALAPDTAHAQDRTGVAFSIQGGIMGPGAGLHFGLTNSLRVQVRGSLLPYSTTRDIEDDDVSTQLDASLRLGGPEVRLDWHPFTSAFHLTAGALYNLSEVEGELVPTSNFEFSDNKTFTPEDIGTMNATVSYSPLSPYLGLGFGDELSGQWSFMFELGAYYTGSPKVDMEGTKLIKPTERNEEVLEEGLKSFQFIPHLEFGLSYQF